MTAIQSCMHLSTQAGLSGSLSVTDHDLGRVEQMLVETRRALGALDRELDQIRASRKATRQLQAIRDEGCTEIVEASSLPRNVVSISRDLFLSEAPAEVVLDPALEKATVEELNAALADAFNHVSGR